MIDHKDETELQPLLSPIAEVIADIAAGKMIVLLDDVTRENEGDLTVATELVTAEHIAFMMKHGKGQICISIPSDVAEKLNLPLQVLNNASQFQTPFAISVDHRSVAHNGVTAQARAITMRKLIDVDSTIEDFVSPGHVFPLIVNPAGVLGRHGQTEGSHDLAAIANCFPSGVICEILNEDGTVAKGDQLTNYAKKHNLKVTSVIEIAKYRMEHEVFLRNVAEKKTETDYGLFDVYIFEDDVDHKEHIALIYGDPKKVDAPLVRVHSECLTGDVFGSQRCDCRAQLDLAMQKIVAEGVGIVLYMRQEGRGIGLANKLRAYQLQDQGADTVDANIKLGFAPDLRNFAAAAKMLQFFGISKIRLMTNNPDKIKDLSTFGVNVTERVPSIVPSTTYSKRYIETKKEKMGHMF